MIKKIILILTITLFASNCSFDTKSGIWTNNQKITKKKTNQKKVKVLFTETKVENKEFNNNFLLKIPLKSNTKINSLATNDLGPQIIDILEKKSKYSFSRIRYFKYFTPELVFNQNNLIFFDKIGSIVKFDDSSEIIWKKNYYSKEEKKLLPILNLSSKENLMIITDNLANYYSINVKTGELLWKKNHESIFISEIKIDNDKFYVIDSNNKFNCFSLKDGKKLWEFNTDNDLIKSQKKLSIVYDKDNVFFNNSRGDIFSLNKDNGNLVWLTPTRRGENLQSFLLKTSQLVLHQNNLFFSNNKNTFFSLDKNTGIIDWSQKINSELKPVIVGDLIFTISTDGYLFIIEKKNGNILRITDILRGTKYKGKKDIFMSGFVVGLKKIYLSLNNGKILQIDISNGKVESVLKVSGGKISEPFVNNGKMFIVKDDKIIKLN